MFKSLTDIVNYLSFEILTAISFVHILSPQSPSVLVDLVDLSTADHYSLIVSSLACIWHARVNVGT